MDQFEFPFEYKHVEHKGVDIWKEFIEKALLKAKENIDNQETTFLSEQLELSL